MTSTPKSSSNSNPNLDPNQISTSSNSESSLVISFNNGLPFSNSEEWIKDSPWCEPLYKFFIIDIINEWRIIATIRNELYIKNKTGDLVFKLNTPVIYNGGIEPENYNKLFIKAELFLNCLYKQKLI